MDFPVRDLDMSGHVVRRPHHEGDHKEMVYELSGVLNHYGNMQGGHYTGRKKVLLTSVTEVVILSPVTTIILLLYLPLLVLLLVSQLVL